VKREQNEGEPKESLTILMKSVQARGWDFTFLKKNKEAGIFFEFFLGLLGAISCLSGTFSGLNVPES
jgi:hypothetical protein